jgi:polyisoprenoid-binding protein YceI
MNRKYGALVLAGLMAGAGGVMAGIYQVDPLHSTVGFSIRHLAINEVVGFFTNFTGTIEYDAGKPESSKASGTVKVASVDTRVEARDKHLRSPDFFEVDKYPDIKYETVSASKVGDEWVVKGRFTMRGITREIDLKGTLSGPVKDPWGKTRIGLTAATTINRQDYGLKWSQKLDSGGLVLGDLVKIELHLEAVAP